MNEMNSAGVGIVEMSYNWISSIVTHDAIGSYAHFHDSGFTVLILIFYELTVPTYFLVNPVLTPFVDLSIYFYDKYKKSHMFFHQVPF